MCRDIRIWLVALLICSSTGCAKTVTQIISYGDQMSVEVTLRGIADASANRYYLILASGSTLALPLPPPDNITYELIEPGTTPIQGILADYYTNYYSTWSGYVVLDPGGYYIVKGPFVPGSANTREALANLGSATTTLKFTFRLSRIFDVIPDQIYFDLATAAWPNGQAKLPADHLATTNAYISKVAGSMISIDDDQNNNLDPALDILRCKVEIQ